MAETTTASAGSNSKTNAILAWLFAPITSLIWMNDKDEFLKYHAKQSLAWGITSIIGHTVCFFLSFIFIGMCIWPIWSILDLVVRIYGLVKANNGEKWEVPVVGGFVK
jgi:uncharacterized membrane protein